MVREVRFEMPWRADDFCCKRRAPGRNAHQEASRVFPAASLGLGQKRQVLHVCVQELMAPSGGCTCHGRVCLSASHLWSFLCRLDIQPRTAGGEPSSLDDDHCVLLQRGFVSPWRVTRLTITLQSLAHFRPDLLKSHLKMFWAGLLAFPLKQKANSCIPCLRKLLPWQLVVESTTQRISNSSLQLSYLASLEKNTGSVLLSPCCYMRQNYS